MRKSLSAAYDFISYVTFPSVVIVAMLVGCTEQAYTPVTVNRGNGVEAISSQTVVVVPIDRLEGQSYGTAIQCVLVTWLRDNPSAKIIQMNTVGSNGHPQEIVLLVEGDLGDSKNDQEIERFEAQIEKMEVEILILRGAIVNLEKEQK